MKLFQQVMDEKLNLLRDLNLFLTNDDVPHNFELLWLRILLFAKEKEVSQHVAFINETSLGTSPCL